MERNGSRLLAAMCTGLALGACTTMGTGTGSTLSDNPPVRFSWISGDGGLTGTMSATLADGTPFSGPYVEATTTEDSTQFFPMWSGWTTGWGDWGYGRFAAIDEEQDRDYSGQVVANLGGPGSQHMRCVFTLNNPPCGMGGGGQGKCQLDSGTTVDATFPRD
jgi:hypothetical protein